MKKTILAAIIAATALVPPAALAQDRGGRWGGRGDRGSAQQSSQPQAQPQRSWGGQQDRGQWRQQRQSAPTQQWRGNRGDWNRGQAQQAQPQQAPQQRQWRGYRSQDNNGGQVQQQWRGRQADGRTTQQWRGNRGQDDANRTNRDWNRGDRNWNRGDQDRNRGDRDWNRGNRDWNRGDRNWSDNRGRDWNRGSNVWRGNRDGRWNNGWRNDRRYDWRGYRNSNRGIYRLPRYYAPGGWGYGYRRFSIGFTLSSLLFAPQYWINDPYYYRLPEVDGPYRWVRYYNDALLVDIETGEVVDTIYDIFW